jgi:hypothetical protein
MAQRKEETEQASELSRVAMAMAPTSFLCFLTGRPVGKVPLPKTLRRALRISYKAGSDEKDKLPSGDDYLGIKLRKLPMVALAAGVLIARFRLGLLHASVLLCDPFQRRSLASTSASSRRSSSHTSSSGVRRRRPRTAAARA